MLIERRLYRVGPNVAGHLNDLLPVISLGARLLPRRLPNQTLIRADIHGRHHAGRTSRLGFRQLTVKLVFADHCASSLPKGLSMVEWPYNPLILSS